MKILIEIYNGLSIFLLNYTLAATAAAAATSAPTKPPITATTAIGITIRFISSTTIARRTTTAIAVIKPLTRARGFAWFCGIFSCLSTSSASYNSTTETRSCFLLNMSKYRVCRLWSYVRTIASMNRRKVITTYNSIVFLAEVSWDGINEMEIIWFY